VQKPSITHEPKNWQEFVRLAHARLDQWDLKQRYNPEKYATRIGRMVYEDSAYNTFYSINRFRTDYHSSKTKFDYWQGRNDFQQGHLKRAAQELSCYRDAPWLGYAVPDTYSQITHFTTIDKKSPLKAHYWKQQLLFSSVMITSKIKGNTVEEILRDLSVSLEKRQYIQEEVAANSWVTSVLCQDIDQLHPSNVRIQDIESDRPVDFRRNDFEYAQSHQCYDFFCHIAKKMHLHFELGFSEKIINNILEKFSQVQNNLAKSDCLIPGDRIKTYLEDIAENKHYLMSLQKYLPQAGTEDELRIFENNNIFKVPKFKMK